MKKQCAAALVVFCLAHAAQAAQFNVVGVRESFDYQNENPGPGGWGIGTLIGTPTTPSFTGNWTIDLDAPSLAGDMDFEPFSMHFSMTLADQPETVLASADFYFPHSITTLDMAHALASFDAATRTLSVAKVTLIAGGEPGSCTTTGAIACSTGSSDPGAPRPEFLLSLVFDPSMTLFTGSLRPSDVGPETTATYSFSGTAVPVPAALWLFSSGLIGLGVARRRAARA